MPRIFFGLLLSGLLVLSSCSSSGSGEESGSGGVSQEAQDAADMPDSEVADEDESGLAGEGPAEDERGVITNAHAALEVDDTREAVGQLLEQLENHSGFVENREESVDAEDRVTEAQLTLRVPAEHLTELLEGLEDIGELRNFSESARDVTGVVRDLDARIDALETSVDRLLEIMGEASSADELLQVETTLSERQADLESLEAERNAIGDQVAMSTLEILLTTEEVRDVNPEGFTGGLQTGWNGLVSVVNGLLVAVGALLPWLPVLAVPGLGVYLWLRRRRKAHAAHQHSPTSQRMQPQVAVTTDPEERDERSGVGSSELAGPSDGEAGERD